MKDAEKNDKVTDLGYLQLVSKGDQAFVRQMINIFLEENPKEVDRLEKAVSEKNYDGIRSAAHKLKSGIPFVGLNHVIEDDLADMEASAVHAPDMEKMQTQIKKIKQVCEKARVELKAL